MKFKYLAFTQDGKKKQGIVEAENMDKAAAILQEKGLKVVEVVESEPLGIEKILEMNIGGVPINETIHFFRQMSYMLGAGLPITSALRLVVRQTKNKPMKSAVREVEKEVKGGSSLYQAMLKHPKIFDKVAVNLIKAGEESGNIDVVFDRLATDYEKKRELRGKIVGALIYPAIVIVAMVAVIAAILLFMIPSVEEMYKEFGAEGNLPTSTRLLISISHGISGIGGLFTLATIVLLIFLYTWYRSTKGGREVTDSIILKVPIFGDLVKKNIVARFCRTFSMLLGSGVEMLAALRLTSESLNNTVFSNALERVEGAVEKGAPISSSIAAEDIFPPIVSEMVKVGEETGKIDETMAKIADYYEKEVDQIASNLTRILEPVIMIVVAVIIGFIAIAVYSPLFSLGNIIGQ